MGIVFVIVLFIWMSRTKGDRRRSDLFQFCFRFFFLFAIISSILPSLSFIGTIGTAVAIIVFIVKIIRGRIPKQTPETDYSRAAYDTTPRPTKSTILPRPVTRRLKIVRSFNEKYRLTLTEEQMQRIVDSSYMSEAWKLEVESMVQKYETVYEWFQGDTRYLRAYIYAFEIQEISSDFPQQEKICLQAFEQVWSYADSLFNLSLEERIARVNAAYYTSFDNITFMIAYRYLEKNGHHHKLDTIDLVQDDADLEHLKQKYAQDHS